MTNLTIDPQLNNEQRYMALLALTSQGLPAKPPRDASWISQDLASLSSDQWQLLYQRLDGDPEALELFLRREKQLLLKRTSKEIRTQSVSHSLLHWMSASIESLATWLSGPRVRYAAALGVTALVATLIVLQQVPRASITEQVEQAFASVAFEPSTSANKLVLPWEHSPAALGFAAAPRNDSARVQAFAIGLLRGKQRLGLGVNASVAVPSDNRTVGYAALGEWNVLLWATCEAAKTPSRDFWQQQATLAREFAAADYATEDSGAVSKHLATAIDLLEAMASGDNSKRNARRLADELTRFREEIASSAPDPVDRTR